MMESEAAWSAADLRAWRERMGWSVDQAAAELRLHPYSLRNLENGRRGVSDTLRRLTEFLERERQTEADRQILGAAWAYHWAVQAFAAAVRQRGAVGKVEVERVNKAADAMVAELNAARGSAEAMRRARWLASDGRLLLQQAERERDAVRQRTVPDPLAISARHGTVGEVAPPVLAGGGGVSLHSVPLVMEFEEES